MITPSIINSSRAEFRNFLALSCWYAAATDGKFSTGEQDWIDAQFGQGASDWFLENYTTVDWADLFTHIKTLANNLDPHEREIVSSFLHDWLQQLLNVDGLDSKEEEGLNDFMGMLAETHLNTTATPKAKYSFDHNRRIKQVKDGISRVVTMDAKSPKTSRPKQESIHDYFRFITDVLSQNRSAYIALFIYCCVAFPFCALFFDLEVAGSITVALCWLTPLWAVIWTLATGTTIPEAKYSISAKDREDFQSNLQTFQTILFFEPFAYAVCGSKPRQWKGHALGLVGMFIGVVYCAPCIHFVCWGWKQIPNPYQEVFPALDNLLKWLTNFKPFRGNSIFLMVVMISGGCFVFARVFAVMLMLRNLKILGDNGVKEFGPLQVVYKIYTFFDDHASALDFNPFFPWFFETFLKVISCLILLPFAILHAIPVIGSAWMFFLHKKLFNLLSMADIKEASGKDGAASINDGQERKKTGAMLVGKGAWAILVSGIILFGFIVGLVWYHAPEQPWNHAPERKQSESFLGEKEMPKATPTKLIADLIVEEAIRREIKKPTGELTKADLEKITSLRFAGIRSILINRAGFTDASLLEVAKLQQLTLLDLDYCSQITDMGLREVAKLQQLTSLRLIGLPEITDAGLKEVAKLKQLTSLELVSCNQITDVAVSELEKALPKCNIVSNPTK